MNKAEQIERAIHSAGEILENVNENIGVKTIYKDGEYYDTEVYLKEYQKEDIKLAIESLQQALEREKNEPLTLEQLEGMVGEPVFLNLYIDVLEGFYEWGILTRNCDGELIFGDEYIVEIITNNGLGVFYKYELKESD